MLHTSATRTQEDGHLNFFLVKSRLQGTWGQETFLEDTEKWSRSSFGPLLMVRRVQRRMAGVVTQPMLRARLSGHDAHGTEFVLLYMLKIASSTLST